MKRIYNILIFALFSSALFAHEGHGHGNPVEGLSEVNLTNLNFRKTGYSFGVAALYTASDVKSAETRQSPVANPAETGESPELVTYTGWFKDRHCTWSLTPASVLAGSCSVACGTGGPTGQSMLTGCQAYGHGIWLNPTSKGANDGEFLGFDAESAELLKAFLLQLHPVSSDVTGKLSLEVTGYRVKLPAKDVVVSGNTRTFAPVIGEEGEYEVDGFHAVSVRGVPSGGYAGFTDNDYKLTLDALAPKNVVATSTASGYNITFDAPVSAAALSPKFGVKGYEVNIYDADVLVDTRTVTNDPATPLTQIAVDGLNYTFHLYTADGKLYEGHTEVYIALKDFNGNFVEDFTVGNFAPVMDMGAMSHSTPVGKVEKVDGKPLYKTWFAGLMDGDWELAFDYTVGETSGSITGAAFSVTAIPAGQKWIQSFNAAGKRYYASIAYPLSYVDSEQTLRAYINERIENTDPYLLVEGGHKIVVTPQNGTTVLPAVTLLWNTEKGVYEGAVNFTEEGLWTLYFKILDANTNALLAGDEGTDNGLTWKINVECATGITQVAGDLQTKVYPTVTQGDVTVEVATDATVSVFSLSGQRLQSLAVHAGTPLTLNLSGYERGSYLLSIRTVSGEVFTRKVILK